MVDQPQQCRRGEGKAKNRSWDQQGCGEQPQQCVPGATRRVGLGTTKRVVGVNLNTNMVVGASLSNVGPETTMRVGLWASMTVGADLKMGQVVGASNLTRVMIIAGRVLVTKVVVEAMDSNTANAARL